MRCLMIGTLLAFAALAGCEDAIPGAIPMPEIAKLEAKGQAKVTASVLAIYGTPDDPKVPADSGLDLARALRGRDEYRGLCLYCHGANYDGRGPGSVALDPPPRDFRQGTFKFTSTQAGMKPCRADLLASLTRGMPLARMPSFSSLEPERQQALIDWVLYIAQRGDLERRLATVYDSNGDLDADTIGGIASAVTGDWHDAESAGVDPPTPMPAFSKEVVDSGDQLFHSPSYKCSGCHGDLGKGDGPSAAGLKDDWGNPQAPRDFTLGVFRGGSRPIDVYRSIACGVKGTPMPGFAETLKPEQIWALVQYVKTLGARSVVW